MKQGRVEFVHGERPEEPVDTEWVQQREVVQGANEVSRAVPTKDGHVVGKPKPIGEHVDTPKNTQ